MNDATSERLQPSSVETLKSDVKEAVDSNKNVWAKESYYNELAPTRLDFVKELTDSYVDRAFYGREQVAADSVNRKEFTSGLLVGGKVRTTDNGEVLARHALRARAARSQQQSTTPEEVAELADKFVRSQQSKGEDGFAKDQDISYLKGYAIGLISKGATYQAIGILRVISSEFGQDFRSLVAEIQPVLNLQAKKAQEIIADKRGNFVPSEIGPAAGEWVEGLQSIVSRNIGDHEPPPLDYSSGKVELKPAA